MKTILYTKLDDKIQKDWQTLWEKSTFANFTNSLYWFLSVLESFNYPDYVLIALYEHDRLLCIIPLIKDKKYLKSIYAVMPADFVFGNPFLLDLTNHTLVKNVIAKLLALGTVTMNNIPKEFIDCIVPTTKQYTASIQAKNYTLSIIKDGNGLVEIHSRNKLVKEIRGIENKFVLQTFDGTEPKGLNVAFSIDNQSRKQNRGYNTFADKQIQAFYVSLGKHFKENMLTHILYFENKPIAYELGFSVGKTYYCSQKAYLVEYQQYSPGKVLKVKVIDYLGSNNFSIMDFGSGDDHIKRTIADKEQDFYHVIISNSVMTRYYLNGVESLRNTLFYQINKHKQIYSVYKKIKKSVV